MALIHAVYENGIFRPLEPVQLPEKCEVEFEPKLLAGDAEEVRQRAKAAVYAILSERYDSGEHDVAERHNEHQP